MIESCIVIVFLCLFFLGLFQLSHAYVARDVLYHAAARAARAKTVGFSQWMVEKTARVAAIPNAGALTYPAVSTVDPALDAALATLSPGALWDFALHSATRSPTIDTELARIPEYLASYNAPRAGNVLDYANWNSIPPPVITIGPGVVLGPDAGALITAHVQQPHDLLVALGALATGDIDALRAPPGQILLAGHYSIEEHYALYLDDLNW